MPIVPAKKRRADELLAALLLIAQYQLSQGSSTVDEETVVEAWKTVKQAMDKP